MSGWDAMQATDAALLPALAVQQIWLRVGWAAVLAWLALVCVQRLRPNRQYHGRKGAAVALIVGLWTLMPGTLSPAYWLGLAFQAPSAVTLLLCLGALVHRLLTGSRRTSLEPRDHDADRISLALLTLAVVSGWVLLLDSFALLPVSLYAWGFGPAALGAAALLALLVAAVWPPQGALAIWHAVLVPLAVMLFVALRLPTGNVWDAVLDPCLWLVLQVVMLRRWIERYKKRS